MRIFTAAGAAALFALLTVPAHAQFSLGGSGESQKTRYSDEEKKNEAANEKAYKDAVKNTRGANNEAYDPWRAIRPATPAETKKQR